MKVLHPDPHSLKLATVPFCGSKARPEQGEWVAAYGTNSCGDESVAVVGTVSQPRQSFRQLEDDSRLQYIQISCITMPGMSGSPVCDVQGRVVGMVVKKIADYGLAAPAWEVREVAEAIEATGQWTRPRIGLVLWRESSLPIVIEGSPEAADRAKSPRGVLVDSVAPNSPAAQAGVQRHDVITAVNGRKVMSTYEVDEEVMFVGRKKTITLTVDRNGKSINFEIVPVQAFGRAAGSRG
eukprot:Selendium_serpulae@DN5262_c0_g1_i3.p1